MKTSERHQLKTNEVAEQVAHIRAWLSGKGRQVVWLVAALAAVVVVAGVVWAWRTGEQERAGALLADAMATADAPVVPSQPPGSSAPPPPAGSFTTEQARSEAALKKYLEVVARHPSTPAGIAARYAAASLLVATGRAQEAEQHFREVAARDSGIHGRMARMGLAELQVKAGKFDEAIAAFRELAAQKDGDLPVDGVLMQLARVYQLSGKRAEALQTFQRVVDEFPQSIYAAEARRAADELKAGTAS